jgi:tRNA pseudouridine55 synthase
MDGIIIINKSKGYTSHDIVNKAKKVFNEKVGHTGTLDPNATGVLPLLIGKGTAISKYLINHDKTYEAVLQLGEKKDTADIEGITIEEKPVPSYIMETEKVKKALSSLIGKQEQIPPIYSAIKVNGKKLYEYARKGESIEIKPRNIEIYNIELLKINKESKTIEFRVKCSKGTYIRTLCEEIAKRLETVGYMKDLKRTQVGEFKIEDAIQIEELENRKYIDTKFITIEKFFEKSENIKLENSKIKLLLNGVQLTYNVKDGTYKIYQEKQFIGIGTVKNKLLKRDIIVI